MIQLKEEQEREKRLREEVSVLCTYELSWKNMKYVFVDVSPSTMVVFTLCILWCCYL